MSEADFLLTDEFVVYSQKIAEIYARKKLKEEELRTIYETAKSEMAILTEEARVIHQEWEEFKALGKQGRKREG